MKFQFRLSCDVVLKDRLFCYLQYSYRLNIILNSEPSEDAIIDFTFLVTWCKFHWMLIGKGVEVKVCETKSF